MGIFKRHQCTPTHNASTNRSNLSWPSEGDMVLMQIALEGCDGVDDGDGGCDDGDDGGR